MDVITIIAYIGSVAMVLGYLPQAIHTMRTRNTEGIAMTTFTLMAVGALAFAIQAGYECYIGHTGFLGMFITNVITTLSSVIISAIKIHNDYFKKK